MGELISIIIPVYNVEKYLKKCLDSILCQSYKNWELLLIDDGSSDGSGDICDFYQAADNRIRTFHNKNSGVSSARNCGLKNMTGTYFTCIDADDWLDDAFLSVLLENAVNTNADVTAVGYKRMFENGKEEDHCITSNSITLSSAEALNCACDNRNPWVGFAWGKLYKSDIIDTYGICYDEEISICEDSLFNYNFLSHSHVVTLIPGAYYNYRIRLDSATNTAAHKLDKLITRIEAFERALLLAENYPESIFLNRITAKVYDSIVFYISSMFRMGQYNTIEVEKYRKRLDEISDKADFHYIRNVVALRGTLIRKHPKTLFFISKHIKR